MFDQQGFAKANHNLTISDGTSGDGQGSADEILLSTNRLIVVSTSGFGYFKLWKTLLRRSHSSEKKDQLEDNR